MPFLTAIGRPHNSAVESAVESTLFASLGPAHRASLVATLRGPHFAAIHATRILPFVSTYFTTSKRPLCVAKQPAFFAASRPAVEPAFSAANIAAVVKTFEPACFSSDLESVKAAHRTAIDSTFCIAICSTFDTTFFNAVKAAVGNSNATANF